MVDRLRSLATLSLPCVALGCKEAPLHETHLQGTATVAALDGASSWCDGAWPFAGESSAASCPDCDFSFALTPADPDACSVPSLAWGGSDRALDVFLGFAESTEVRYLYSYRYDGWTYDPHYKTVGPAWFLSYTFANWYINIDGSVSDGRFVLPFNDAAYYAATYAWDYGQPVWPTVDEATNAGDTLSVTAAALDIIGNVPPASPLWTTCASTTQPLIADNVNRAAEGPAETLPADAVTGDKWTFGVEAGQSVAMLVDAGSGGEAPALYVVRPDGCLASGPEVHGWTQSCSGGAASCPKSDFIANVAGEWGAVVVFPDDGGPHAEQPYTFSAWLGGQLVTPTLAADDAAALEPAPPGTFAVQVQATLLR